MPTERVGDVAFEAGVRLHELSQTRASLEQAFMELTADSVEYHAGSGGTGPTGGADPVTTAVQPAGTVTEQAQAGRTS